MQEDIDAALKNDSDAETEGNKSGDESDSCSSSCGVQSSDEEKPRKKRKSTASSANPVPSPKDDKDLENKEEEKPDKPKPGRPTGSKPPKEPKGSKQDRVAASLTSHEKTLQSLREITAEAIWKSLIRATELERRVTRATAAANELQKIPAMPAATEEQKTKADHLAEEIRQVACTVSAMKELSKVTRSLSPADMDREIHRCNESELAIHFGSCKDLLAKDGAVLMDVVTAIAKKLLEVAWIQQMCIFWFHSQGHLRCFHIRSTLRFALV